MHRSRLTALGIDVPADVHAATATFWASALGGTRKADKDGTYVSIGRHAGVDMFVQRVGSGGPRVHLDIETDDVEAEVSRLERLGAERVEKVSSWWILRDPSGQVFCVVSPQPGDFPEGATTWS